MGKNKKTIEMRVHHLDMLKNYIRSGRKQGFIKDNLILAQYDKDVTNEELDSFVSSIYDFYEKILKGEHKIKLVSEADGICDGGCTLRRLRLCNPEDLYWWDVKTAGIEGYNIEVGKSYSLEEVLQVIEEYDSLSRVTKKKTA